MKYLFLFSIILSTPTLAQIGNPFDSISYDRVVAYEFQGEGGRLIKYCLLEEKKRISKSIELSRNRLRKVEKILTSNSSYGSTTASCFDPHLAIVYYKNDKIIASINVCLDCNYLLSSIEITATKNKLIKVSKDYSYPARGFSKEARKSIHQFCNSIGFTKYLKPLESIFDQ